MNGRAILIVDPIADLYGAGRTLLAIASDLTAHGYEVHVWSPHDQGLHPRLEAVGVRARVVALPVLRRREWRPLALPRTVPRFVRAWWAVRREARAMSPRPVAVHAMTLASVGGLVASRAVSAPLLWSVHEVVRSRLEKRVFVQLLRRADAVVACSRFVARQFDVPTQIIYSGADLQNLRRVATTTPFLRPVPRVVCVGRLNAWKGQDVVIEACGVLHDRGRSVECILVGSAFATDIHVESGLRDLVEALGLTDAIRFLGQRSDVAELVADADIAVVPSKVPEPFGKTVIEAMALGRPVIASAGGGPSEVIRDGVDGLLVPPGDPVALADAIVRLLDDPDGARRIGERAARRAEEFDEAHAAAQYTSAIGLLIHDADLLSSLHSDIGDAS
jgi:glycosyltransferase involved in cell wall biosynthesis